MTRRLVWVLALSMCAGLSRAQIQLEQPAAVGKPVWLKIPPRDRLSDQYPFRLLLTPAGFGCSRVELRRNGQPLAEIPGLNQQSFNFGGAEGNLCESLTWRAGPVHAERLPLHLRYRFEEPGTYEVRYTASRARPGGAPAAWTDWTPIEIQPGTKEARAAWLKEMAARAPSDATELLADFLPSILGIPDAESLALVGPYLYHADRNVRIFASAGLTYWPAAEADAAAAEWQRTKGPSDVLLKFRLRR
jgi:hypothetical protein